MNQPHGTQAAHEAACRVGKTARRRHRIHAVLAALCAAGLSGLAGCSVRPKNDPFFGAQVVPAPATASAAGARTPPGKDYYPSNSGSRPGGTSGNPYTPPGGFGFGSGTSATRSSTGGFKSVPSAGGSGTTSGAAGTSGTTSGGAQFRAPAPEPTQPRAGGAQIPAENNQDKGTAWPSTKSGAVRTTPEFTRPTAARFSDRSRTSGNALDQSNELNFAETAQASADSNLFRPSSRVRGANYQEQEEPQPTRVVHHEAPADEDGYGYDPNYRWLKGKLEYLSASRRWKLRYVPFNRTTTDAYRGSVILADAPELENCRPGDFVTVYGRIDEAAPSGYSPTYRTTRIELARM